MNAEGERIFCDPRTVEAVTLLLAVDWEMGNLLARIIEQYVTDPHCKPAPPALPDNVIRFPGRR